MASDTHGFTINITGSNNDSNLVLGSSSGFIKEDNLLTEDGEYNIKNIVRDISNNTKRIINLEENHANEIGKLNISEYENKLNILEDTIKNSNNIDNSKIAKLVSNLSNYDSNFQNMKDDLENTYNKISALQNSFLAIKNKSDNENKSNLMNFNFSNNNIKSDIDKNSYKIKSLEESLKTLTGVDSSKVDKAILDSENNLTKINNLESKLDSNKKTINSINLDLNKINSSLSELKVSSKKINELESLLKQTGDSSEISNLILNQYSGQINKISNNVVLLEDKSEDLKENIASNTQLVNTNLASISALNTEIANLKMQLNEVNLSIEEYNNRILYKENQALLKLDPAEIVINPWNIEQSRTSAPDSSSMSELNGKKSLGYFIYRSDNMLNINEQKERFGSAVLNNFNQEVNFHLFAEDISLIDVVLKKDNNASFNDISSIYADLKGADVTSIKYRFVKNDDKSKAISICNDDIYHWESNYDLCFNQETDSTNNNNVVQEITLIDKFNNKTIMYRPVKIKDTVVPQPNPNNKQPGVGGINYVDKLIEWNENITFKDLIDINSISDLSYHDFFKGTSQDNSGTNFNKFYFTTDPGNIYIDTNDANPSNIFDFNYFQGSYLDTVSSRIDWPEDYTNFSGRRNSTQFMKYDENLKLKANTYYKLNLRAVEESSKKISEPFSITGFVYRNKSSRDWGILGKYVLHSNINKTLTIIQEYYENKPSPVPDQAWVLYQNIRYKIIGTAKQIEHIISTSPKKVTYEYSIDATIVEDLTNTDDVVYIWGPPDLDNSFNKLRYYPIPKQTTFEASFNAVGRFHSDGNDVSSGDIFFTNFDGSNISFNDTTDLSFVYVKSSDLSNNGKVLYYQDISGNENQLGLYSYNVRVSYNANPDMSFIYTRLINVVDTTKPVISSKLQTDNENGKNISHRKVIDSNTVVYDFSNVKNNRLKELHDYSNNISIFDHAEGNLAWNSDKVTITVNGSTQADPSLSEPQVHVIRYSVKDRNQNISDTYTRYIIIGDTLNPRFVGSTTGVNDESFNIPNSENLVVKEKANYNLDFDFDAESFIKTVNKIKDLSDSKIRETNNSSKIVIDDDTYNKYYPFAIDNSMQLFESKLIDNTDQYYKKPEKFVIENVGTSVNLKQRKNDDVKEVKFKVTDLCGNNTTFTLGISFEADTLPPKITFDRNSIWSETKNIEVYNDPRTFNYVEVIPKAFDWVAGDVNVDVQYFNKHNQKISLDGMKNPLKNNAGEPGVYKVMYSATDGSGKLKDPINGIYDPPGNDISVNKTIVITSLAGVPEVTLLKENIEVEAGDYNTFDSFISSKYYTLVNNNNGFIKVNDIDAYGATQKVTDITVTTDFSTNAVENFLLQNTDVCMGSAFSANNIGDLSNILQTIWTPSNELLSPYITEKLQFRDQDGNVVIKTRGVRFVNKKGPKITYTGANTFTINAAGEQVSNTLIEIEHEDGKKFSEYSDLSFTVSDGLQELFAAQYENGDATNIRLAEIEPDIVVLSTQLPYFAEIKYIAQDEYNMKTEQTRRIMIKAAPNTTNYYINYNIVIGTITGVESNGSELRVKHTDVNRNLLDAYLNVVPGDLSFVSVMANNTLIELVNVLDNKEIDYLNRLYTISGSSFTTSTNQNLIVGETLYWQGTVLP